MAKGIAENGPFIELENIKKELKRIGAKYFVYIIWSYGPKGRPIVNGDYIGSNTGELYRPQDHFRSAKRKMVTAAATGILGQGKIHDLLFSTGPQTWMVDILYIAKSDIEAQLMENFFQHHFESVEKGLNKKYASINRTPNVKQGIIRIKKVTYSYSSYADLCRQLFISPNTLIYHLRKGEPFKEALQSAIEAAAKTKLREPIVIGRRTYDKIDDALADIKHANKHNLTHSDVKMRRSKGMNWHDAFTTAPGKKRSSAFTVCLEGKNRDFKSVVEACRTFEAEGVKIPGYSTITATKNTNQTYEQAFGFARKRWEKPWEEADRLIKEEGYKLVGVRRHEGRPLVLHETKEVFASKRAFADTFNYEYTSTAEALKTLSPSQFLLKKKHPMTKDWDRMKSVA